MNQSIARGFTIIPAIGLAGWTALAVAPAAAQIQFVEQQSTRFPQPALNEYTNQVAIGDIDKDNDLDLLLANGQGFGSAGAPLQQRLFINNGSGVFTDESVLRGMPLLVARDGQFGDVDGDDDLDIIFVQDFAKPAALLLNDGTGKFTNVSSTHLPAINLGAPHATFIDIENDGDLDLVIANGTSSRFGTGPTQLWVNDGTGHFTDKTAINLPSSPVSQPMEAIAADVNADFDLDFLIGARSGVSKLFINNGQGVFALQAVPAGSSAYSFDFGDIDGDTDLDLIGINNKPGGAGESIWTNNGLGVYTDVSNTSLPGANNPSIDDNDSKFFDPDYDGDLDFVVGSLGPTDRYYQNNGSGVFTIVTGKLTALSDSTLDIEMADLDNDNDLDFVTVQGESGSFIDRIYINTLGPADTRAPRINKVETLQNTSDQAGPYVVRAEVRDDMTSDSGAFFKSIVLSYTLNGGTPILLPMKWMGHEMNRAAIPGQPCGTLVAYKVIATDRAGNVAQSAEQSFAVLGYADCDESGSLSIDDFICFQTNFAIGDPAADCDASGSLTIDDFICFQTLFAIGC